MPTHWMMYNETVSISFIWVSTKFYSSLQTTLEYLQYHKHWEEGKGRRQKGNWSGILVLTSQSERKMICKNQRNRQNQMLQRHRLLSPLSPTSTPSLVPPCLPLPQKVISSFRHILLKSQFFQKLSFLPRLRACHLEVMCKARDNQVELSDSPQRMVPCLAVMLSEPVPQ